MRTDTIFVLNAGSSSLKFRIFGIDAGLPLLANGRITGIGANAKFVVNGTTVKNFAQSIDQQQALHAILDWLKQQSDPWNITVMGHRIVHGGESFTEPVQLDENVLRELTELIPLAPLHQPHALSAVKTLQSLFPEAVQIGCFDTAFHAGHTEIFRQYAIPKQLRESGIRRYGFHGLSYEWTAHVLGTRHASLAQGRIVAAHLGNGASLCAMQAGKSIDTTMGMTALEGLPMGTRCGNIDPGAVLYLLRQQGMNADEVDHLLSYDSGLKGLSGVSGDMQELLKSDSAEARFAIDFFTMMTAQHVARMAVALGGIDTLVFTGGIGEHSETIRNDIARHLEFLQPFNVLVVEADEERMIAAHCLRLIKEEK